MIRYGLLVKDVKKQVFWFRLVVIFLLSFLVAFEVTFAHQVWVRLSVASGYFVVDVWIALWWWPMKMQRQNFILLLLGNMRSVILIVILFFDPEPSPGLYFIACLLIIVALFNIVISVFFGYHRRREAEIETRIKKGTASADDMIELDNLPTLNKSAKAVGGHVRNKLSGAFQEAAKRLSRSHQSNTSNASDVDL